MLVSFITGFKELYKHPGVFLPGVIAVAINMVLLFLGYDVVFGFLYHIMLPGGLPEGLLLEMPFLVLAHYYWEILATAVFLFLGFCVNIWAVFAIAKYIADEDKGRIVGKAIKYATARIGKIASVAVFAGVLGVIFFAAFLILFWLALVAPILGLVIMVLMLALAILIFYLYVKLLFLAIVMGTTGHNVKNAIPEVWRWSSKRFWELLVLIFALTFISSAVLDIGIEVSNFMPDDNLELVVPAVFSVLAVTYSNVVMAHYYLKTKKGANSAHKNQI